MLSLIDREFDGAASPLDPTTCAGALALFARPDFPTRSSIVLAGWSEVSFRSSRVTMQRTGPSIEQSGLSSLLQSLLLLARRTKSQPLIGHDLVDLLACLVQYLVKLAYRRIGFAVRFVS